MSGHHSGQMTRDFEDYSEFLRGPYKTSARLGVYAPALPVLRPRSWAHSLSSSTSSIPSSPTLSLNVFNIIRECCWFHRWWSSIIKLFGKDSNVADGKPPSARLDEDSTPSSESSKSLELEVTSDGDTALKFSFPVLDREAQTPPIALIELPDEVLLDIFDQLSADSLYCVRQTCIKFMNIFDHNQFKLFHRQTRLDQIHKQFNMEMLYPFEQAEIANSLQHHEYCAQCIEAEDRGVLSRKMKELRQLLYCEGCSEFHPGAFFFKEDRGPRVAHAGKRECIGRSGLMTMCKHSSDSPIWKRHASWQMVEQRFLRNRFNSRFSFVCDDPSHEPEDSSKWSNSSLGCAFPRSTISCRNTIPITFDPVYGWDLPLLDISPELTAAHTTRSIRQMLSNLAERAVRDHHLKLCPHMSVEQDIQSFVQNGICRCFKFPDVTVDCGTIDGCHCRRQRLLECRICSATCTWRLKKGRVALSYRYIWEIHKPTSLGWLCALDQWERDILLGEDTRHVLWCNTPQCRTNRQPRWEALIKDWANTPDPQLEEEDDLGRYTD